MKRQEIFKPGTWTDMHGKKLTFSEADIQATLKAYDPALFRAPLVVGHPKTNDPAYGWVESLDREGDILRAVPEQVDPEFAEMVNNGRFPKISSSFFHPNSSDNPKPGVWYLRHVGYLGAAAPAVKGLKTASFADNGDGVITVEFAAEDLDQRWLISRLVRGLRDWMLEAFGSEAADKVVPQWIAEEAESAARIEAGESPDPSQFSAQPQTELEDSSVDPNQEDNQAADFAAREAELSVREQELAKKEAQARKDGIASFAEQLIHDGKLLPVEKEGLVAFMAGIKDDDSVSFASSDGDVEKPANEWLRGFLSGLPARVDFSEHSADDEEGAALNASFSTPAGYSVNPERLQLHNKVVAYQAQHKCDYNTALAAVDK